MNTNRKRLWMTTIITALLLAVFIVGCKKDDFVETPGVCPVVVSTIPANGATDVRLNQIITATFNEKMNPATITDASFTLQGGLKTNVSGTLSYNEATATMSFTPTALLLPGTTYTGTVKTVVKDLTGNALQTNYIWSFVTGEKPTVISTDPANLATGVVLTKVITATFSIPMNPASLDVSTFILRNGLLSITGVVSYTGTTASFTPSADLTAGTIYTATITTGAKSSLGNALAANYVWQFTTLSNSAPLVISTDPVNNATDVVLNKIVTASFNMPMNPATITTSTFTLKNGATSVSGIVSYNDSTAYFVTLLPLSSGTVYTATITNAVKSVSGVNLAANYVWTFTTGSIVAPIVISTDPINNESDVALDKMVSATFSMEMDPLTLNTATFTLKNGLTPVNGSVSYNGTTATFVPLFNLLSGTVYTATITTGAKNIAGIPLANKYIWRFTTVVTLAPTVISTDPANNATNVALDKTATATFSVPMDPLTITDASFTLFNGSTPVTGIVSYSSTTASFNPNADLLPGTVYTATITTAAKNVAGIPLDANYIWTFTTAVVIAPTVISTIPENNASGVALNQVVSATFSVPMDPLTITVATFTLFNGAMQLTGNVSYTGSTASFAPSIDLLPGTVYTATVTTGAMNPAGVPLDNDYVWTFTTLTIAAPTVISTIPADNAIDVALNQAVSATFSEPMDPLTITAASFTLFNGANQVTGSILYTGSTATFTPDADLLSSTVYTATITTAAMNPAGVPLESDYVWSFTTLTVVVPPPVDLQTASMFGAFGGNAGVTNQGINTLINGAIATTAASTLITGFHDGLTGDVYTETPLNIGLVTNGIYTAPPFPGTPESEAVAIQGLLDATDAYNSISPASMPGGTDPGAGELGGLTLAPGVYMSASGTFNISNGPLTLDAQGDPNAYWVFQTAAGLTVGIAGPTGARSVELINGALPKNVFWYVGSAATINGAGGGIMVGTIISMADVTFSTPGNAVQTVLNGRAISLVASVTMVNTTITVPEP